MTTPAQGKGKKKNIKVSPDKFKQVDSPRGHSVVNVKVTGLGWTTTMANYDQKPIETQQVNVPTTPRSHRTAGIDIDSLPNEPPYKVGLYNLSSHAEDKEISDRFFQGINVVRVENSRQNVTVELASRNDLYEALCKDGASFKGRTVNVCLYGQTPQSTYGADRYSGRGNSSYGDRYGDRNQGGFGQRGGDRHSQQQTAVTPPAASSYYAGAKFLSPPVPSSLPMPPRSWLRAKTLK